MLWAARSVAQPACTPDASLPIPVYPCELNKLEGIFTPLAGSAERAGPINEPALRRFISWQIDRGVHGLYPNSSTGEFTRFSVEERRRIVHVVTAQAGGAFPCWRAPRRRTARRRSRPAKRMHTWARACHRGAVLFKAECGIGIRLFCRDRAPCPSISRSTTSRCSPAPSTFRPSAEEFPRVIGIRDSSGDLAFMMRTDCADSTSPARFHLSHRMGSGAGSPDDGGLRRRHTLPARPCRRSHDT
jgi:hypothetical protein